MKIEIIQYEPEHGLKILDQNVKAGDTKLSRYEDWEQWIFEWKKSGPSYTMVIDGEIVGSAGVILLQWKRGEAWTLLGPSFQKYIKHVLKGIKKNLDEIAKKHQLRRVQAVTYPGFERGKNFLRHLGFEEEGTLRAFGPNGEDLVMFGRVYKWQQQP